MECLQRAAPSTSAALTTLPSSRSSSFRPRLSSLGGSLAGTNALALALRTPGNGSGASARRPQRFLVSARAAPDLKQELQEFAAAEKRWQQQVRDGRVKQMTPKEAGYSYQLADYVLLDVRPSYEREKSWVKDSVWVPAFEPDRSLAPGAFLNKATTFLFGGWWSGNVVTKRNERFMADVVAQVPRGSNIIVACQRGLRSLAACEHLYKAGYRNIFWINGGFDAAEDEDFTRDGPQPLKFAGLGGFSEFIGMTDQQRVKSKQEGFGYSATFFARIAGVLLGLDLLVLAYQQLFEAVRSGGQ